MLQWDNPKRRVNKPSHDVIPFSIECFHGYRPASRLWKRQTMEVNFIPLMTLRITSTAEIPGRPDRLQSDPEGGGNWPSTPTSCPEKAVKEDGGAFSYSLLFLSSAKMTKDFTAKLRLKREATCRLQNDEPFWTPPPPSRPVLQRWQTWHEYCHYHRAGGEMMLSWRLPGVPV